MAKRDTDEPTGEMSDGLQVELFHPDSDREPGDTNIRKWGFDIHPQVFPIAVAVVALFIALTLLFQKQAASVYTGTLSFIGDTFGWFYIAAVNIFILVILFFALSKYGNIKIGGVEAEQEFSDFAWMAMLFSAGMGIGLMFWSVAEPMYHFASGGGPFFGLEGETAQAGQAAMGVTYFHWGFHPWAIYALVGLGLAFFSFNRGLPLTFRSIFWPLLGERIYGWPGHVIDIVTVFATLFGLSTSLGLGVQQINAGLNALSGQYLGSAVPETAIVQVVLIAVITGVATLSVAAGLESGVKRLSTVNLYLMLAFLGFILIVGPTLYILGGFVQSTGFYLQNLPALSFFTESFVGGEGGWQSGWTIFYWGWWVAWSPFVGMFIARISKGRTVREFVLGVLILPSLFSFFWMSAFGGSALFLELESANAGAITQTVVEQGNVATAMFEMLSFFPLATLTSILAIVLVTTFFVTSSDSGSLVVDHLTSGGKHDVPRTQRVFWAVTEGAIAAVLLVGGGLEALQAASIATGLPFAVILLLMCYTVYLGLYHEHEILESEEFRDRITEMTERDGIEVVTAGEERVTDVREGGDSTPSDD